MMDANQDDQQPLLPGVRVDSANDPKKEVVVSEPSKNYGKHIVYVDESGDHAMQSIDAQYPIFVLAFCVFHKKHYSHSVVPALELFKFKHFGHDQIILHENEIRKEKGVFRIFPTRKHKNAFMDELTSIVDENNFILISSVIKKEPLKEQQELPQHPYHIALGFCLETVYNYLKEKGEEKQLTHIVFERRGKNEDKELELEFRRLCDGHDRKGINKGINFPFKILFSDKKAMSSGLQLADLVARPIGLHVLRSEQPNRAFDILKNKFYCSGGRKKTGENYEGWGLKIYPSIKSERP